MFESVIEWLRLALDADGYVMASAPWTEADSQDDAQTKYCAVSQGGRRGAGEVRTLTFSVFLIGPRQDTGYALQVLRDAEKIIELQQSGVLPCGAMVVRISSDIMGPGQTQEGRRFASLILEILL